MKNKAVNKHFLSSVENGDYVILGCKVAGDEVNIHGVSNLRKFRWKRVEKLDATKEDIDLNIKKTTER